MKIKILPYIVLLLITAPMSLFAQLDNVGSVEELIHVKNVENLNPVYKPIIGLGVGTFNFLGDVRNPDMTPFNGDLGYRLSVSTFIDNNHYVRANFYLVTGALSGNERSYNDLSRNMNFKSDILMFGFNMNYDFDNLLLNRKDILIKPFISIGFETFNFTSKTDSFANMNGENIKYHYWPGTNGIYNGPRGVENNSEPIERDYVYETPLRKYNWGVPDYPQYAFAVPIEIGFDFWLSDRVMFTVATSYHYTTSDLIDHVSSKNDASIEGAVVGNKGNDSFLHSYISLHLDLFSSDKTLEYNKMADFLAGDVIYDLVDGDMVPFLFDKCPDTPWGAEVDSVGCPIDSDLDGVPDYMDIEKSSRYGAIVDDQGVEYAENELLALLDMSQAVARSEIDEYIRTPESYSNYSSFTTVEIPEKFKAIDTDTDGRISYEEMMDAIDKFFDFESDLSGDDIRELNDFFFSQ